MHVLTWLFALYARYFVVVFAVGTVVLGFLYLISIRSQPRVSPEPAGAQPSAREGRTAA